MHIRLSGFNGYPVFDCQLTRPEKHDELIPKLPHCIARGSGLSYSDAAINQEGYIISTTRLNRFLYFDPTQGILIAEAGVTLREIFDVIIPAGWFLPVIPGSSGVSLGGAIAADVHGKNHWNAGSFSEHVAWFELITANQHRLHCSATENQEVFLATMGGMGLTGLISTVCLMLKKIKNPFMEVHTKITADLEETIAQLVNFSSQDHYSVAWLDAQNANWRGVVTTACHASCDTTSYFGGLRARDTRPNPPYKFRINIINRFSIAAFNFAYYAAQKRQVSPRYVHYRDYFFPLEKIQNWPFLYGKNGFIQYQCVFPFKNASTGIRSLLHLLKTSGLCCSLVVLKRLGPSNSAFLSFAKEGITIAIDLPFKKNICKILHAADRLVLNNGGRVYLAKDTRLTSAHFFEMYPAYSLWKKIKEAIDPNDVFQSSLSKRLLHAL